MPQQKIVPNLWFDTKAEEAAEFYVSVFGGSSRIVNVTRYNEAGPRPAGTVMTVEWELDGQRFVGINGGPEFKFSEAVSLAITGSTMVTDVPSPGVLSMETCPPDCCAKP